MGLQWQGHREELSLQQGFLRGCRTKPKQNEIDDQEVTAHIKLTLFGNDIYCTENYLVCYFWQLVFCFKKKLVNKRTL